MSEVTKDLEARTRRAILEYALMRWETAGVLAGSLLASLLLSVADINLFSLPNATWFILGLAAYIGLAYSSFKDERVHAKIVEDLLRAEYTPKRISNPQLKAKIEEALDYRTRITRLIEQSQESVIKSQLETMAEQFDEWIEEIYDLAQRLDTYENQKEYLKKTYDYAVNRQEQLRRRLASSRDDKVKQEIEQNIESLRRQIETIESLGNTMKRAELRLENTLTAMGTIYPQTMLLSAKDIDSDRYKRLQQEIADEVDELADVLYAMDEVYSESEF